MEKLLIYILFCVCHTCCFAQSRAIDSLSALLEKHSEQDIKRVNILLALSEHSERMPLRSDSLAKEALFLSRKLQYAEGEAIALGFQAVAQSRIGNIEQAFSLANGGLDLAKQIKKPYPLSQVSRSLAIVYRNKNELDKAQFYFEQALQQAEQTKDLPLIIKNLFGLGQIGVFQTAFPKAQTYLQRALTLAKRIDDKSLQAEIYLISTQWHSDQADYVAALENAFQALKLAEFIQDQSLISRSSAALGSLYVNVDDPSQSITYSLKALKPAYLLEDKTTLASINRRLGWAYRSLEQYPKAIEYFHRSLELHTNPRSRALVEGDLAATYELQGNYPSCFKYAFKTLATIKQIGNVKGNQGVIGATSRTLARAYLYTHRLDSALWFGKQSLQMFQQNGNKIGLRDATKVLAEIYDQKKEYANAYYYLNLHTLYVDSLNKEDGDKKVALLQHKNEMEKKEASIALLTKDKKIQAQEAHSQRQLFYGSLVGLVLLLMLAGLLLHNNRVKQRANNLLTAQKEEIDRQAQRLQLLNRDLLEQKEEVIAQRDQLSVALSQLHATQAQLIQKEKMASLGELTAGIAHEIQNPLNFVNNFSEVSAELVAELKYEAKAGNPQEVIALAEDLTKNLEKIHQHGKRADSIVKGMLEHSKVSSGEKQPTDINRLVDEYLRLAYHGLRAKEKDFDADFKLEADPTVDKLEVVPQEIGRVLLNLFNNAFYATAEKKARLNGQYLPQVLVITKAFGDKIEIRVRDNGIGIPESIKGKIFQPFFTTKPTGEGTGLGLSLSYDIITKGHNGELKVESKEGEYSEFIICLPVKKANIRV